MPYLVLWPELHLLNPSFYLSSVTQTPHQRRPAELCTDMNTHVYTIPHTYTYTHMNMHTHAHTPHHTHAHIHISHAYMYTHTTHIHHTPHTHTYIHTHEPAHTHTHTHHITHIYTHMRTHTLAGRAESVTGRANTLEASLTDFHIHPPRTSQKPTTSCSILGF